MDMDPLLAEMEKRLRDTLARDATVPPAFAVGDMVSNRFLIVGLLGSGGMGEVYEADDVVLHERVALKTLSSAKASEERAAERLKREIALARRVTHPNVCRVFDAYEHQPAAGPPILFFTMERLTGHTLGEHLARHGRMTMADALPLVRQMAAALDAAHAACIVHGDFKPGNVMLVPPSSGHAGAGGERLVVTDFGLARPVVGSSAATLGWGTPAYMAPEQLAGGQVTPRSDVYALGLVVDEMVTDAGTPWRECVDKCLARDPAERFATPGDFVGALEVTPRTGRRWTWIAASGAGVAAVALLVAWLLPAMRTARPAPGTGVPASVVQTVAVLPFDDPDSTPDAAAFSRGLAAVLTEQLHLASALDRSTHIRALPSEAVIEGDLRTPDRARRSLGADVIVAGRVNRNDQIHGFEMTLQVGDKNKAIGVFSGDRILLPSAMASLASVLDLKLSPGALKGLADGGTSSPEAEVLYLRGRGYLLLDSGVDAAIDSLQRARQADGAFALAVAALSDAYRVKYTASRDSQFLSLAQSIGDDAIKLDASVAYSHIVRGNIYVETSQYERAIREFQVALTADPTGANARRRLAEVYEGQGSVSLAEDNYKQEIELYPHYWRPLVDFGSFLIRRGRYKEAESNLLTAVQYAPGNVRAIGNLAGFYGLTERFFAAEAELQRGFEVAGPNAIGLNNLAWVYMYEGRLDEAAKTLEQAVQAPGADSMHWSNLARVYRWSKRRAQARTTYAIAIKRAHTEIGVNPQSAKNQTRANLASMLAETSKPSEALAEMASALERAPTDVSVLFRSAVVHELTGDRVGALKALEAAARGHYSPLEIRRYPDLAELRKDPRFLSMITLSPPPPLQ